MYTFSLFLFFHFQTSSPSMEVFKDLLDKNPDTFYPTRTPKSLHSHWLLMKHYHLLPDQSGKLLYKHFQCLLNENNVAYSILCIFHFSICQREIMFAQNIFATQTQIYFKIGSHLYVNTWDKLFADEGLVSYHL